MTYNPLLIPFSTINGKFISVNRSNFTVVSLNYACHENPKAGKSIAGSS